MIKKPVLGYFLLGLAATSVALLGSDCGESSDGEDPILSSSGTGGVDAVVNLEHEVERVEQLDAIAAEQAAISEGRTEGLAYWQARYAERLKSPTLVVRDTEESWIDDSEAVAAFQKAMREALDVHARELASPDEAGIQALQSARAQAAQRLDGLQKDGMLGAVPSDLVYELLPDELFAFSLLAAEARKNPDFDSMQSLADVPPGFNFFRLSPEEALECFGDGAGPDLTEQLGAEYDSLLREYLGTSGRLTTLKNYSQHVAMEIGLLPPHESWLSEVLPEADQCARDIESLNASLQNLYFEATRR